MFVRGEKKAGKKLWVKKKKGGRRKLFFRVRMEKGTNEAERRQPTVFGERRKKKEGKYPREKKRRITSPYRAEKKRKTNRPAAHQGTTQKGGGKQGTSPHPPRSTGF